MNTMNGNTNTKASNSRNHHSRVKSAHPRANRLSELAREMANSSSDAMMAGLLNKTSQPFGMQAEVRQRKQNSRMSHKQLAHMSMQNVSFCGDMNKSLSHIQSDAKLFATGNHSRKKLPIGFLVQQEKRELHKMGMHSSHSNSKIRPDSAKVTYGERSRTTALL